MKSIRNELIWWSKNLPVLWKKSFLFGQGLVRTCAGHTGWDVPLSAFGLDLSLVPILFWFHKVCDLDVFWSHQLISEQRLVKSEDWAARGLLQIVSVCVSYRNRERRSCLSYSGSLFLVFLHVSWTGWALYWCVFPLLQWCVWPRISSPYSIMLLQILLVPTTFILNSTGNYTLDNLFSPQGVKYLHTGMSLSVSAAF